MKKIALISEHASPLASVGSVDSGGQNVYVAQVARHLARAGVQVDVFTRKDNPLLADEQRWLDGVNVIHVPAGPPCYLPKEQMLSCMGAFSAHLQQHFSRQTQGYDVIHANFFMSALAALPVAQSHGVPLVVTFHALGKVRRHYQQASDQFADSRFGIEDDIVRYADSIIPQCPQDRRDLLELYTADPRRIDIVPCGYDAAEMKPQSKQAARIQLGLQADDFTLLHLSRMVPRKGADNVIRALATLRHQYGISARLLVVGGNSADADASITPEIGRLRELAETLGVLPWVHFTGRRQRHELATYYSASDVFVTTPWYESFGITSIEAMACARPVVGSDVGGIRTTVVNGKTGFLVPPKNPDLLAERLAQLASNQGLCERLGEAGRLRARRLYKWQRISEDLLGVYERVHAGGAHRRLHHLNRIAA